MANDYAVRVDGGGADSILLELFGEAVGAVLGAGEHQHLFPGALGDQVGEQGALVAGGQVEHALFARAKVLKVGYLKPTILEVCDDKPTILEAQI